MNSWKIILATIVIYGAGVMTGGLLVHHIDHGHPKGPKRTDTPGTAAVATSGSPTNANTTAGNGTNNPSLTVTRHLPDVMNKQFLQRLDAELHLTPEQREAIQKIITDSQNLMHKTVQDARLEIREQLTPEQRSLFDELVKRPPHRPPNATNAPPVLSGPTNTPGI